MELVQEVIVERGVILCQILDKLLALVTLTVDFLQKSVLLLQRKVQIVHLVLTLLQAALQLSPQCPLLCQQVCLLLPWGFHHQI